MLIWKTGNDYSTLFKAIANHRAPGRCFNLVRTPLSVIYFSSKHQNNPSDSQQDIDFHKAITTDLITKNGNWHSVVRNLIQSNASPDAIRHTLQNILSLKTWSQDTKPICQFVQALVKGNLHEYAVDIIRLSSMSGLQMRHNEYEQIVYQFSALGKWNLAHLVTKLAYNVTGKWSLRLFNWHLRSCIGIQNYSFLSRALNDIDGTSFKPSRRTFNLIIEGHLRNSDLANARQVLVAMQEAGFVLDKSTYSLVLSNYPSLGHNQSVEKQAFETLRNTGHASDTMVLNGILQARIAALDIAGVLRLIKLIDISPTGTAKISKEYEKIDFLSACDNIPSRPLSKIRPNKATFNIILTLLARRKGNTSSILVIYNAMKTMRFEPDAVTVASIVLAYGNENKSEVALSIVYKLCTGHGLPVDRKHFLALGSLIDIKDATTSFPGITSVPPNIWIFNALLQVFLPSVGLDGLQEFLKILQSVNIIPDFSTTQIILTYLREHHHARPQMLVEILQTLTNFRSGESILTVEHLNTIFASYINREIDLIRPHSWNASSQRVRFRHSPKFSIEKISHQTTMFDPTAGIAYRSFPRKGVRRMLRDMIKSLCLRNVKSSRATFALRIRREGVVKQDLEAARRVFDIMVSRGIRPNKYHYSALVEAYAGIGMMEQATQTMEKAYADGVKPNLIMYSILIQGYARLGLPDLARTTFKEMVESGVRPDLAAVDSLVSAYWFIKRSKAARSILLDLWPTNIPLPEDLRTASLRDLVVYLRAQRKDYQEVSLPKERYRQEKLKASLGEILRDVKKWQRVEEAVSWTQTGIAWDYILHPNNV